ncbi:alpha/beta hydrolase [Burkholderia mayonis]|uniref:Alpha/beta hydrolase n=1 Tax=Burkholderia mayonis TaxID=1385591 RepID=A0A1B4FWG6_9BURK|nr:alpha/beta hydrolase [Burkholderia mayonis]KVE48030.1 alpha/beta hydrolase [Burkholderia mayonis]
MIVAARERDATWIALPPEQRHDDFFRLDTCVAGHLVQKLINYGVKLAVVGDIDAPLARSRALRALVRETNRGDAFWFVADFDALAQRLCECGRIARTRRVGTR